MPQDSAGTEARETRERLGRAYEQAGEAYRKKDAAALMKLVTDDFSQRMPDGQVIRLDQVEPFLRDWFATADAVTDYEVRIGDLTLTGAEAVAMITENVTTRFAGPDGALHERTQANTARATWTHTPGGWRIRRSEYLDGRMLVDGAPAQF